MYQEGGATPPFFFGSAAMGERMPCYISDYAKRAFTPAWVKKDKISVVRRGRAMCNESESL